MKKRFITYGTFLIILFLLLFGTYKLMNSRTFQLFGGITNEVQTNKKIVALTFDDGPTKNVNPGSIILLHPMYDHTGNELETIDGIFNSLSKKGYKFVTVNELQNM
jgi:peptidoglycan/xylan/chitin deacetylase (PgdA/CDA1 family)